MTLPSKPIVIRLPAETTRRFELLCEEFAGLPRSTVMRMLVESLLERTLAAQVEAVTAQIRGASQRPSAPRAKRGGDSASDTARRPSRDGSHPAREGR